VRQAVPFLACGDLGAGDPDANYDLDLDLYIHREPVQPPTTPAYKTAIELARKERIQGGQAPG
jgi:tRNA (cytidine32/guanosine34-2'-O)-methyltransferase